MPSIFTHPLVGLAAAKMLPARYRTKRLWILSFLCPFIPDLDGIGFYLGLPLEHFFGHRGVTHSVFFALVLSVVIVAVFFNDRGVFSKRNVLLVTYFAAITVSHGILDAITNTTYGVAFFSPIITTRFLFGFTPIESSPLSPAEFFGERGFHVILNEIAWVWMPLIVVVLVVSLIKRSMRR